MMQRGKLSGLGTIARDITGLVKLQDEEAALATIVKASQDAIIGFSKEIKITSWNPAAESFYGFTAAEAIGRGFDLFVPPEDLAAALEADRRVLETGEPITLQRRAQKKDGTWFVSQVNIFPIRDAAGRIVAGAGIGRDITELLKLESQQALLAAIVESSDDAIISLSPEFKIMTWNKGAQKLFGFTAAEAIGKTNLELYVPGRRPRTGEGMDAGRLCRDQQKSGVCPTFRLAGQEKRRERSGCRVGRFRNS